jgi:hypothetical protein
MKNEEALFVYGIAIHVFIFHFAFSLYALTKPFLNDARLRSRVNLPLPRVVRFCPSSGLRLSDPSVSHHGSDCRNRLD